MSRTVHIQIRHGSPTARPMRPGASFFRRRCSRPLRWCVRAVGRVAAATSRCVRPRRTALRYSGGGVLANPNLLQVYSG